MNIIIKQVDCTNEEFLNYYLKEDNLKLHRGLYPINGLPAGFIAIDTDANKVVGAGMVIEEAMHNQLQSYNQENNDTNPWMIAVSVSKNNRNQGIGKKIVDEMIAYCNQLNFSQLNANTETARGFYEKHWKINLLSSYPITNDKNENVITDTFRIDVKENLSLINNSKKIKFR